jgi:hypothetical protein
VSILLLIKNYDDILEYYKKFKQTTHNILTLDKNDHDEEIKYILLINNKCEQIELFVDVSTKKYLHFKENIIVFLQLIAKSEFYNDFIIMTTNIYSGCEYIFIQVIKNLVMIYEFVVQIDKTKSITNSPTSCLLAFHIPLYDKCLTIIQKYWKFFNEDQEINSIIVKESNDIFNQLTEINDIVNMINLGSGNMNNIFSFDELISDNNKLDDELDSSLDDELDSSLDDELDCSLDDKPTNFEDIFKQLTDIANNKKNIVSKIMLKKKKDKKKKKTKKSN